jgi:hydroxymethylpyrimidine/phosphomethylpyrimidine kinase
VHGTTAITALTAQNTIGVTGVHPVPADFIVEQVRTVADDIRIDAVKIGMLGTAETVRTVATALDLLDDDVPVVIDTVMVAESGAVLLDEPARAALVEQLLPRATVITPNVPEARVLARTAGLPVDDDGSGSDAEVESLVRALESLGPECVVVTGGHRDEIVDVFFDGERLEFLRGQRHADGAAHGSGCTHSSALAAHLALGHDPLEAARRAKAVASEAVAHGLRDIGRGAGPVDALCIATRGEAPLEAAGAAGSISADAALA